jgi:hypothetical protein
LFGELRDFPRRCERGFEVYLKDQNFLKLDFRLGRKKSQTKNKNIQQSDKKSNRVFVYGKMKITRKRKSTECEEEF